jgi:hypothetical protein
MVSPVHIPPDTMHGGEGHRGLGARTHISCLFL